MLPTNGAFIRPLLGITKKELLDYMKSNAFEWREDASNAERVYKRNRIRLDLIPLMQSLCGGEDALQRFVPYTVPIMS